MFNKYYCPKCKAIMGRSRVTKVDDYYCYIYRHKMCGEQVDLLDHHILKMDAKIDNLKYQVDLNDLTDWINREAIRRYPKSDAEKKAFKAGIYALLDKINVEYRKEK